MRSKLPLLSVLAVSLLIATGSGRTISLVFENEPRPLGAARSPKFLPRGAHGLQMLLVRPAADGKGRDLFLQASHDSGDTFAEPIRVNDVAGEVSDHGENSPELVESPDGQYFYAVWGGRDPRSPFGGNIRFSRSSWRLSFSPAITVNDDNLPVSHSFQTVGVGPDGTIYVAWLDGRDQKGPNSSIYMARSTNQGQSFEKNVKVADDICPCCRLSITFAGDQVLLAWRRVEPGDVRDIHLASSSDKGQTWSKPLIVGRDGWKINGCPHVGPAIASLGSKVYAAWFTEAAGDPAINLAISIDKGKSFGPKQKISQGVFDPTHPQLVSGPDRLAVVFQARSASKEQGWGRVGVYYREIYPDGAMSELVRLPEGKVNANYPTVALGLSGRIFVGWTESHDNGPSAYLIRGRALTKATTSSK